MSNSNEAANQKLERFLTSRIMLMSLFVLVALVVIYAAFTIPDGELKNALQNSAQLTITVALGIGALILALNGNRKSLLLMQETIVFILLSILSYYLSFVDTGFIQRVYIVLSGIIQLAIISQVYQLVLEKQRRRSR